MTLGRLFKFGLPVVALLCCFFTSLGFAQQMRYDDYGYSQMPGPVNVPANTPPSGSSYSYNETPETPPASGQGDSTSYKVGKPLSVTITKSLYLPPDMYGHWSVTGTLIDSSANSHFNPIVHDIWILERRDEQIVVTNPVTNASASIEVDKVDGNTATFHRMMVNDDRVVLEMPTLTVNGDYLSGTNIYKSQRIKNGKIVRSFYGKYRLEAKRIGRSRVRFKGEDDFSPKFEIEDVQFVP